MSGLDNLNKRLSYHGGNAEGRFDNDKLASLKKSLLYSYQAETIMLEDGREFRCLINPNKETGDYDNKIISIPYKDVCLNQKNADKTSEGIEEIGLKCGDVFTWERTDSHWLVYLQYIEEDSYFRAQIRKCEQEVKIGEQTYWAYIRGPVETSIQWAQKGGVEWNSLNYSLVMYITKDDNTLENLHRFYTFKIDGKTWQVAAVNPYWGDGIIQVGLDEYFENSIQEAVDEENAKSATTSSIDTSSAYISGNSTPYGYSTETYTINNAENGTWYVSLNDVLTSYGTDDSIKLDINMGGGSFTILYKVDNETVAELAISIQSI